MTDNLAFPLPVILYDTRAVQASAGQCDCDCDCACSSPPRGGHFQNGHLLSTLTAEPNLLSPSNFHTIGLDHDHLVCYGPHHTTAVLSRSALAFLSLFGQAQDPIRMIPVWRTVWGEQVVQSTLEQMIALGLLVSEGCVAPPSTETPTTLSAWLHVTNRCNLRCAYCYLPHTRAEMSMEIGRAAIEAALQSALNYNYRQVKLKYAGGEPLLRTSLVIDLYRYARQQAEQYGLELDGVVLSNGTLLTPKKVKALQSLDLRLMISMDGLGDFHDCQRRYANGRASSADVKRSVELALAHGLVPHISITVSGRNVKGLPELVSWILEHDLPFSLNFYRENDQAASLIDLQLEEKHIIKGMLEAYQVVEANLPRRSLLASLVDRANLAVPHSRTCSAGHSYLVFDPQGRVAKCQMDISRTITDVHDPDPLGRIRESTNGIRNLTVDEKSECCDCFWRYWCTGGCSLMAYRSTGRHDAKSPNCNIYRALYPEAIRLEGLRLLALW